LIIGAVALGIWAGPVRADEGALDVLDAPLSYRADFSVSSPRGVYHGKVWHRPGHERRMVETRDGEQAVLIDRAKDAAYLIGKNGSWSVGLSLSSAAALIGGIDSWRVERSRIGEERVGTIRATRWKALAQGPRGQFDGEIWTSHEGIIVKADGVISSSDVPSQAVSMILSDLKTGPVDPALLDLPQGGMALDLRQVPPDQVVRTLERLKPLLEGRSGR
jgi:hypothetical protein